MEEFHDWELLHDNSDEDDRVDRVDSVNSSELLLPDGIEGDSEGMIRSDYFSLDSHLKYNNRNNDVLSEEGSIESDNPSWIDPVVSENRYKRKNSGEFWSDSGSDRSKLGEDLMENEKLERGFEGISEIERIGVNSGSDRLRIIRSYGLKGELGLSENEKIRGYNSKNKLDLSKNEKIRGYDSVGLLENEKNRGEFEGHGEGMGRFWSDSSGEALVGMEVEGNRVEGEMGVGGYVERRDGLEVLAEEDRGNGGEVDEVVEENEKEVKLAHVEEEKKGPVWWKLPVELLKFCVFRISPVWSISIAAAMVGFVILKRRLYKMKQKNRSLQIKVTMDDKKVSQFMSRAARLNEAFSVVRRVPVIRPSLPAPGVTPWPVINLR